MKDELQKVKRGGLVHIVLYNKLAWFVCMK